MSLEKLQYDMELAITNSRILVRKCEDKIREINESGLIPTNIELEELRNINAASIEALKISQERINAFYKAKSNSN